MSGFILIPNESPYAIQTYTHSHTVSELLWCTNKIADFDKGASVQLPRSG